MKTLTINEPWASLIVNNIKTAEIRSWKTKYRGPLLIHSGKTRKKEKCEKYADIISNYATSSIIGQCELIDCVLIDQQFIDNYNNTHQIYFIKEDSIGYYAWILSDIKKIEPINNIKGQLSLWEYKNSL